MTDNLKSLIEAWCRSMYGRCISADHVAESGTRAISLCMMTGEAAGIAAAIAIENNVEPKNIPIDILQERLREGNRRIPE